MDWTLINTLLSVIHQAASAGPKYAYIIEAADADLTAAFQAVDEEEADDGDDA